MKKTMLVIGMLAPLMLSGCVVSVGGDGESYHSSLEDQEYKNRKKISQLSTQMTLEMVESKMGVPDFNEFYQQEGDEYQVLYYRTHRMQGDGMTSKDECTPLVFKNGMLVGWGEHAFNLI